MIWNKWNIYHLGAIVVILLLCHQGPRRPLLIKIKYMECKEFAKSNIVDKSFSWYGTNKTSMGAIVVILLMDAFLQWRSFVCLQQPRCNRQHILIIVWTKWLWTKKLNSFKSYLVYTSCFNFIFTFQIKRDVKSFRILFDHHRCILQAIASKLRDIRSKT